MTAARPGPSQPQAGAPTAQLLADAAETFALLATPARVHLLWLLARGEHDVSDLAEQVGVSVANVSQHLAKLRLAGLVDARRDDRDGRRQLYVVDDRHVLALVEQALDHHAELRAAPTGPAGPQQDHDSGAPATRPPERP